MDRRTALRALVAGRAEALPNPGPNAGLSPYTGIWDYPQVTHLLRRSMFGATYAQIKWSKAQGLNATLDKLFENLPMPAPPVHTNYTTDAYAPLGSTWVNAPFSTDSAQMTSEMTNRSRSLDGWTAGLIMKEGVSIREKLTLFWHNHFPIRGILDPRFVYRYVNTLRTHAMGNFKALAKAITIDPAMLRHLNGRTNTNEAPNENYPREFLELFSIGKGALAAPGDYTNYTEQDVKEIARIFTGWKDYGFVDESSEPLVSSRFTSSKHDTGTKKLSYRFDNQVIGNLGDQEYAYLIDMVFKKVEVARFISRKLYRWFVFHQIDEAVELNVIQPMADLIYSNNYDIKPALRALLGSQHFFDARFMGAMVKSPVDFLATAFKSLNVTMPGKTADDNYAYYTILGLISRMQQSYYNIPEIAGWRAYYEEPLYYRLWISAATIPFRKDLTEVLLNKGHVPFKSDGSYTIRVNALKVAATLERPEDPNSVVQEFARILLPMPLGTTQFNKLKAILAPSLSDSEWTKQYTAYKASPSSTSLSAPVDQKLRKLLQTMLGMPEFYMG